MESIPKIVRLIIKAKGNFVVMTLVFEMGGKVHRCPNSFGNIVHIFIICLRLWLQLLAVESHTHLPEPPFLVWFMVKLFKW